MISEKYIMQRIKEYANTDAGKKAIKKRYGVEYSEKIDLEPYRKYGRQMKSILFMHVNALIRSITEEDIIVAEPKTDAKGFISVTVSFREGSLQRDSLYKKGYPEGIENIILLFAHGYHAKDYAYGVWKYGGYSSGHSIRSRKDREPNNFLQDAVEEFNMMAKGKAIAFLDNKYQ